VAGTKRIPRQEARHETKLLSVGVGIINIGRLRGGTNDGDNDHDYARGNNDGSSAKGGVSDPSSAAGAR